MGRFSLRIALCIMARAPEPGQVKTRLCPPLSVEDVIRLYHAFLLDKIAQVRAVSAAEPTLAYAPDDAAGVFETELDGAGDDAPPRHTRRLLREVGRIFVSGGRI